MNTESMNTDTTSRRKYLAMKASGRYHLKRFLEETPCVKLIEMGPEIVSGFSPEKLMFDDPSFQYLHQHPDALFTIDITLPDQDIRRLLSCFDASEWFFLGISNILPWLKVNIDVTETSCMRSIIQSLREFIIIPASQSSAFGVVKLIDPDRYAVLHKPLERDLLVEDLK